ncbi:hypothetical protein [Mesorhizobium sp. SP-1A]|uniref:hypothetical protein n=1 Tax=Mesorhizobium sp. SP-1A TaxID=3077840 RepID=UPI0028F6C175|nr:hypothetical protein [Mesorhizobium sp. SP-1A]
MAMNFSEGQTVNTKYGVGKITYFDDDYMDVVVNGKEYNFFAPFEGKVQEYTPPPPKDQIWRDILARPDMAPLIALTKLNLHGINFMMSLLNGSTAEWDELTPTQKMNHVAVATAIPLTFWAEAKETGKLDDLISQHSRGGERRA